MGTKLQASTAKSLGEWWSKVGGIGGEKATKGTFWKNCMTIGPDKLREPKKCLSGSKVNFRSILPIKFCLWGPLFQL